MKYIKNIYFSLPILGYLLITRSLKGLRCGMMYRFVLLLYLFIVPLLSYGQLFTTADNTLPIAGLENVHVVMQENVEPFFYVHPTTIISKSTAIVFFVDGGLTETVNIVQIDELQHYHSNTNLNGSTVTAKTTPVKATFTEVKQCDKQATPFFPWDESPLKHTKFYCTAVVASGSNENPNKKGNIKLIKHHAAHGDVAAAVIQPKGSDSFGDTNVPAAFGKKLSAFSTRPPPMM